VLQVANNPTTAMLPKSIDAEREFVCQDSSWCAKECIRNLIEIHFSHHLCIIGVFVASFVLVEDLVESVPT
jgi:hypothetical protein